MTERSSHRLSSTRRLSALWFADIVGYSSLAARNEDAALRELERFRGVCSAAVEAAGGRLVKFVGDGALAEFHSTEAAARAALTLQRDFAAAPVTEGRGEPGALRIGLHVGDVAQTPDNDLYGDGVNTASRLQTEADAGQIVLSGEARRLLASRPEFRLEPLGERWLKGLLEPVALFSLHPAAAVHESRAAYPAVEAAARRSLAVLPFANLSSDPENEYLSDGLTEELLTTLAQVKALKVVARTSSFALRNSTQDVREIGRKLGAEVVLEGSVRRAGNRLRVTAQLVSAKDGYHIWSSHFDRQVEDVFELQDELARTIVDALLLELTGSRQTALVRPPTHDLQAYDAYLRGRAQLHQMTEEGLETALACLAQAVDLDPEFGQAYAGIASTYIAYAFFGPGDRPPRDLLERARAASIRALELDASLADAHAALGTTRWACDWDFSGAEAALRRAVELRPGDALLQNWFAWALLLVGRSDECHAALRQACELDPLSPWMWRSAARALYLDRQYDAAESECRKALARFPDYALLYGDLAAIFIADERWGHALTSLEEGLRHEPGDPRMLCLKGCVHARQGEPQAAREILREVSGGDNRARAVDQAVQLVALGEDEEALNWLESAAEARDVWLPWVRCLPMVDDLRRHQRFQELMEKLGAGGGGRMDSAALPSR